MADDTGSHFYQCIHPEDRPRFLALLDTLTPESDYYEAKYRFVRPDGSVTVLEESGHAFFDHSGHLARLIGVTTDVTARERAEEALRASEEAARQHAEELQKTLELAPVAIWTAHDPQCTHITGNPMANAFYEAGEGENVSAGPARGGEHDTTRRFFRNGRELRPEELPMQQAVARGVQVRGVELEVLLPSGRWMVMLGSATPLFDERGRVRGSIGAFMDITARKQTEARLSRFFDSGMMGAIYWNMDGAITGANDKFLEMMGYAREDLQAGRVDWAAMTPPEYRPLDEYAMEELRTTGVDTPYEKEYIRKDGSRLQS
jgi:PAS domain S-box-containing protein